MINKLVSKQVEAQDIINLSMFFNNALIESLQLSISQLTS